MDADRVTFGEPEPGREYASRAGAYAVIRSPEGTVALVSEGGRFYLPGGGLEPGESAEAALIRECREELGCAVRVLAPLGRAVQFLIVPGEGAFRLEGEFFLAEPEGPMGQGEHGLHWVAPEEAAGLMSRPFEAWAIRLGGRTGRYLAR